MQDTAAIEIVGPSAGEVVDVLGAPIRIKSTGDARHMFFAEHPVPVGYAVPMHVHLDEDEIFYILEGEITLISPEGEMTAGPGAFVHLPRGAAHGFHNPGPGEARMLVVASAGGALEGVFRGLDAAAAKGPVGPEQIVAVLTENRLAMA
jgi:mannose-6-phosphate isomerase-like protein (cupin superfamily)